MHRTACFASRLVLNSQINPRSAVGDVEGIKAQILAHAFNDALWVRPAGNLYEIIDGSRRFRAVTELQAEGKLDAGFEIPVDVFEVDDATARDMALATHVVREGLSPADEAVGFYRLKLSGLDEQKIAAHYAVPLRRVQQRLAIGALPDPIIAALRSEEISIATAEAFTLTSSPERQIEVFETLKADRSRMLNSHSVREMLVNSSVPGTSREAAFVGEEAYEAAGGVITRDLFDDDTWFTDGALLKRLFEEKIAATVKALKDEGWPTVEVITKDAWKTPDWQRLKPNGRRDLTRDEQDELSRIKIRAAAIEARKKVLDDKEDRGDSTDAEFDEFEKLQDELLGIELRTMTLLEKPHTPKEMKASAAVIAIHASHVKILKGVVKPAPAEAASRAEGDAVGSAPEAAPEPEPPAAVASYSEAVETLLIQTAQHATKLAMVRHHPALTARLGLAARILQARQSYNRTPFKGRHELSSSETAFITAFDGVMSNVVLPLGSMSGDLIAVMARLEALEPHAIVEIEAALAASTFEITSLKNEEVRAIIEAVDPDMTAEGFAVDETFLKLMGKDQLAQIIAENGATPKKTAKKPELVAEALSLVEAHGWLPAPLRTPSYKGPGSNAWADAHAAKLADDITQQQAAE